MRLPLPTQLKTRVGDNTKDARLKNSYTEILGQSAKVRKRPGVVINRSIGTGDAYFLNCVKLSPSVGGLSAMVGSTIISAGGLWDISASTWDTGLIYHYGDWVFYGNKYWMYTGAGGSAAGVAPSTSSGWANSGNGNDTYSPMQSYAVGDQVIFNNQPWYAMAPVSGQVPSGFNPYWSQTAPTATRYFGTITNTGTIGALCGSKDAAGASAMAAFPHNSCATKFPGPNTWFTFSRVIGNSIAVHQFAGSTDCVTVIDMGEATNYGTITTVPG